MRFSIVLIAALPLLSGCQKGKPVVRATWDEMSPDAGLSCAACLRFNEPAVVGNVEEEQLTELSGLVAGSQEGVYWAHNDSGDTARFFALGASGQKLGEFRLKGADVLDVEDVALGPCPEGVCIFLGDLGDNRRRRSEYAVFRVKEPVVASTPEVSEVTWQKMSFVYPGNVSHNAEAMVVDVSTGTPYIITKVDEEESSEVFRFSGAIGGTEKVTLEKVATLPKTKSAVTAADYHPCGARLLVRTYSQVLLFSAQPGQAFEGVFSASPIEVPVAFEPQGEAIAFRNDGIAFMTASEGARPPLHAYVCR